MGIFLSVHAVRQMEARGITRDEVAEVLANPHTTYTSEDDETCLVQLGETAAGVPLKVVTKVFEPDYVVTVARRDREE